MQYIISNIQQKRDFISSVYNHIKNTLPLVKTEYINLDTDIIRLSCYTDEILPALTQQLPLTLSHSEKNHTAEIIIFKETSPKNFLAPIADFFNLKKNMRLHLEYILNKNFYLTISKTNKVNDIFTIIDEQSGTVHIWDEENRIYYYGLRDFSPEELVKIGHLFVQQIYRIISTSHSRHLVHGAVVGINNTGALICARGGRGKSTLTVNALTQGFDYVSDDYLILDKEQDNLFASPIYSIITLSPEMYQKMQPDFKGKYICPNARFNKYIINIAAYHHQFKTRYQIKVCLFPNIADIETPFITPINKGKAITQLIHSTIIQTNDTYHTQTIKKLLDFLTPFEYYQINLCPDINKNTQCLKDFLSTYKGT